MTHTRLLVTLLFLAFWTPAEAMICIEIPIKVREVRGFVSFEDDIDDQFCTGIDVTVLSRDGEILASTATDENCEFEISGLATGWYELFVEAPIGFDSCRNPLRVKWNPLRFATKKQIRVFLPIQQIESCGGWAELVPFNTEQH